MSCSCEGARVCESKFGDCENEKLNTRKIKDYCFRSDRFSWMTDDFNGICINLQNSNIKQLLLLFSTCIGDVLRYVPKNANIVEPTFIFRPFNFSCSAIRVLCWKFLLVPGFLWRKLEKIERPSITMLLRAIAIVTYKQNFSSFSSSQ